MLHVNYNFTMTPSAATLFMAVIAYYSSVDSTSNIHALVHTYIHTQNLILLYRLALITTTLTA